MSLKGWQFPMVHQQAGEGHSQVQSLQNLDSLADFPWCNLTCFPQKGMILRSNSMISSCQAARPLAWLQYSAVFAAFLPWSDGIYAPSIPRSGFWDESRPHVAPCFIHGPFPVATTGSELGCISALTIWEMRSAATSQVAKHQTGYMLWIYLDDKQKLARPYKFLPMDYEYHWIPKILLDVHRQLSYKLKAPASGLLVATRVGKSLWTQTCLVDASPSLRQTVIFTG